MPTLDRQGAVFVLCLGKDENRFNPTSISEIEAALDEVEATPGTALVTTGEGKQYSSGLDLDWLGDPGDAAAQPFLATVHALLARMLTFPAYTVAALNGHAFAGGAILAAAHDWRVMREDRGFWCLPEVDLGLPFTRGMSALLAAKLPRRTAHEAMVTGTRYAAPAALAAGAVDAIAAQDDVLAVAVEAAQRQAGKNRDTLRAIKTGLYADAERALRDLH